MNFTQDVPLTQDANGIILVKGSRVTLDTLIARYQVGDTVEEIHEGYPSVSVEQIQKIISWYLTHQNEVDEYVSKEEEEAQIIRREIESQPANIALREKLMRRKAELTKA